MLAGFFGGWVDAVLSRVIDIVLGIPLLLGAIVLSKRLAAGRRGPRHRAGRSSSSASSAGPPRPG